MGKVALIWSNRFTKFFFGPRNIWNVWLSKMSRFIELFRSCNLHSVVDILEPPKANIDILRLVHTEDYINYLLRASELGEVLLDYGDTYAYKGFINDVLLIIGGITYAVDLLVSKRYERIYQAYGGLHHARRDRAAGFCPVNDVAIAVEYVRKKYSIGRVAIVDIDVHHADGTQEIFYSDPNVLKISIHMKAPWFYPGTGSINELGEGDGLGYTINIPLLPSTGDEGFRYVFDELVPSLLRKFKPSFIIAQLGVDGHKNDYLGRLKLTTNTYRYVSSELVRLGKELKIPILALGGGGYGTKSAEAMLSCLVGLIGELPTDIASKVEDIIKEEPTKDDEYIRSYVRNLVASIKSFNIGVLKD